jgi:hypothetical protein
VLAGQVGSGHTDVVKMQQIGQQDGHEGRSGLLQHATVGSQRLAAPCPAGDDVLASVLRGQVALIVWVR